EVVWARYLDLTPGLILALTGPESSRAGGAMSNLVLRGSCVLALIIFALPASSQIQNGEITGTVIDPSGAVVPAAKIVLQNLGTRYEIQARTNSEGIYTAKELSVGTYMVRVEAHGFKTTEASK